MKLTSVATLLIAAVLLGACSSSVAPDSTTPNNPAEDETTPSVLGGSGEERHIFVLNHKSECIGLAPGLCLRMRESKQEPWKLHHFGIGGFNFEWGYDYELRILITEIQDPPADGPGLDYELLEIVNKERVVTGTVFDYPSLHAPELIKRKTATEFELGHHDSFTCDMEDCDTVTSLLEQEMSLLMEFRFADDPSDPIHLLGVKCSDAQATFRETCL